MPKVLSLAARNLLRYRRRTLLTTLLITLGVVAMLLFVAASGSFKAMMVGQVTDSMLGHLQVHKRGYVASIDSLPLTLNMKPGMAAKVEAALEARDDVVAWSPRVKLGAMFSNFAETTSIRLNGVDPEREAAACPDLAGRVVAGSGSPLVRRGHLLVPELIAKGLKVGPGDPVVLVATNRDGSVNGLNFVVQGVLEGISGPGGRDGYLHIADARELLRLEQAEVSEFAVRVARSAAVPVVAAALEADLGALTTREGKPALEVHPWDKLSPFANIARMIDLMTVFIQAMLVAIVLVSVMNVMIMAVYERVREVGTLAAMGTPPGTILRLFVTEGLLLGLLGAFLGAVISALAVFALQRVEVTFAFGRQSGLVLYPVLHWEDVVLATALVVAMAVLASLQPAWKAARLDPISALRHV